MGPNDHFCASCGATRDVIPPPPGAVLQDDPTFAHILRFLGVSFAVGFSCLVLVGFFWIAHIRSRTGYRKRDTLSIFVPYYGWFVWVVTTWRYTARDVYWEPREDRPSAILSGVNRPLSIALGWILFPIFTIGLTVLAVVTGGWSTQERADLVNGFVRAGMTRPVAECVADHIITDFPAGPDAYADGDDVSRSVNDALDACAPG
jgi:hypothetical protein